MHRDDVELAAGAQPQRDDLALEGERRVLALLEQLDQALTAVQGGPGGGVQVRGEGGEGLQLAELGQVQPQPAGDGLHRLRLRGPTDAGHRDADVDGRADTGVEQTGLEEDLAVGDRDDVGRDVGRHVVALGLDDRQPGLGAGTELVGQLRAALQQAGVQVEDVAGVGLAARRTAQQQRHRAVGLGLLGQVVEHDQDVLALVHPVLADGRAGVGGDVLVAGRVRGGRGDDGRVLHRPGVLQRGLDAGDGGALLAHGDVDAADLLLRVTGGPGVLLVDDRVDRDRGLAGLAVADDELALTAADRGHGVDGLDPGGQRLAHRLPLHHRRCLQLERAALGGLDVTAAVDRGAQRVHDPAEEAVADRHREHLAGPADRLALLDRGEVTHDHDADLAHVEVQGQAAHPALELQELVGHDRGQPLDPCDAVAGLGDGADLLAGDIGVVVADVVLDGTADLVRGDRELGHGPGVLFPAQVLSGVVRSVGRPARSTRRLSRRSAGRLLAAGARCCRRRSRRRPG